MADQHTSGQQPLKPQIAAGDKKSPTDISAVLCNFCELILVAATIALGMYFSGIASTLLGTSIIDAIYPPQDVRDKVNNMGNAAIIFGLPGCLIGGFVGGKTMSKLLGRQTRSKRKRSDSHE